MDDRRVDRFLEQTEARSVEDLIEAVDKITAALEKMKVEPYVHVTHKPPDIKLPDIHRKETVIINFPTGLMILAMTGPYIIFLGLFLLLKYLPL